MENEDAQRSLGRACFHGHDTTARTAVDAGADVDAAVFNSCGNLGGTCTASHVAARLGRYRGRSVATVPQGAEKDARAPGRPPDTAAEAQDSATPGGRGRAGLRGGKYPGPGSQDKRKRVPVLSLGPEE